MSDLCESAQFRWYYQTVGSAALAGIVSGGIIGGRARARQFLAENAHVLPKTRKGWYHYHRHKNYAVALAFARSGVTYGAQISAVAALFCGVATGVEIAVTREESSVEYLAAAAVTFAALSKYYNLSKSYKRVAFICGSSAVFAMGALTEMARYNGNSLKYGSEDSSLFGSLTSQAPDREEYHIIPKGLRTTISELSIS